MKDSAPEAMTSQRSFAPPAAPSNSNSARAGAAPRRSAPKKSASGAASGAASEGGAPKTSKPGPDAKKRVRLKPETREQLLERLRNPPLSLHETSILLRVSRATVRRYADAGRLPCLRTPGGQRRFALRDIETFYRALKTKR